MRIAILTLVLAAALGVSGFISVSGRDDRTPATDACNALGHQGFVGVSIAAATFPEGVRLITPVTIVTQDFVPTRLNVLFTGAEFHIDGGILAGSAASPTKIEEART
jgi:hypothetical protein